MTKVKTFIINSNNPLHHARLDDAVNKFIEDNNVDVIDIKYSTTATTNSMGNALWFPSAMLIYKSHKNN